MSAPAQIQTKAKPAAKSASVTNHAQTGLVLRKCACGESTGIDGECAECREKKLTVQRRAINGAQPPSVPSSPGQPSNPGSSIQKGAGSAHNFSRIRVSAAVPERMQTRLTVNEPGDKYEQEADQVAEQVMRMAAPASPMPPSMPGDEEPEDESLRRKEGNGVQIQGAGNIPPTVNKVLSSSGHPLDGATRAFMEPRFGHDFSRVRVHTDAQAMESTRAVNALAYTVGRDVVFGAGQYTPGTTTGKELLAHELTHVVQQSPLSSRAPGHISDSYERKVDTKDMTISTFLQEGGSVLNTISSNSSITTLYPFKMSALDCKFSPLSIQRQPSGDVSEGTKDKEDPEVEYNAFRKEIQEALGGKENYKTMREKLIKLFGSLNNFKAYYEQLVPANFPSDSSKIRGHDEMVHPEMQRRLAAAAKVLENNIKIKLQVIESFPGLEVSRVSWLTIAESGIESIKGIGGLEIRPNVNRPEELSKHSWGCAIDINASTNPNVPGFPTTLVKGLTGIDVFSGPSARKIQSGGTTKEVLEAVNVLHRASDLFKETFSSKESLKFSLNAFLKNQGANVSEDKFNNLFNRLENVPKDLLEEARKEIKSKDELLKAAREAERKGKRVKQSSEPRHPTSKPQEGYTELMNLLVVDMKLDELKARDAAYFLLEAYRVYLGTINKTPDKTGGKKQPQKKSPVSKTVDMATTLKTSDDVIEQIIGIVGEKSGAIKQEKKISSKAIGTAETIAAHGFINLPSELIAALVGSEGGGLKWLGSVFSGTKDFMHFELEKCDLSVPSTQTTLPE